jgi:protein-glutamine gamma-glutamyltransferase
MKSPGKLLYFASFVGLAVTAAVVIDHIGGPTIAPLLLAAVVAAALAGAPGLVHRRAWPVAVVLLPLGAYLLLRAQLPPPPHVHGVGQQIGFYLEQLRSGARTYAGDDFPLDFAMATGVRVLLSLVVYVAIGLAAFMALSLRKALPAIVIVLALLGFGFTTDGASRVVWTPFAFLVLAGCMLVFSRSLQRKRWRATDALAGAATAMIAALLALSLLSATSVAASRPWQDWHKWGIVGTDSARLGFNWMENFPRLLDPTTDAQVMRVRSPLASYWRANALASFDGTMWFSSGPRSSRLTPEVISGSYVYRLATSSPEPPGKLVTESFQVESMYTNYFFTGGSPQTLAIGRQVLLQVNGALALGVDPPLGPKVDYAITAVIPQLKPADLVGRGRDYPWAILAQYDTLPFRARSDLGPTPESAWRTAMSDSPAHREWLGLYQLNQDIVGSTTDPYGIALKVEEYLRLHYVYSLTPPHTGYQSPYAAFLFQTKTGYCQHFAGAMAVLLRFNGVPARVAVGFTAGRQVKDGTFVVTRNDAHAWVEAYFPGVGWATFDPTPGRTIPGPGASSASAGFVDSFAGGSAGDAGVSPGLTPDPHALRKLRGADVGGARSGAPAAPSGTAGWLPLGAVLAVVLVAWPIGRAVLRKRGLRRGGCDARLRASLALVYVDLKDHGVDVPRSQTLDETARFLKGHLDLDAGALVDRVQAVLFGGRAATQEDLADVAAFRRELKRRMRARRGRVRAVLALYGLPAISTQKA